VDRGALASNYNADRLIRYVRRRQVPTVRVGPQLGDELRQCGPDLIQNALDCGP